MSQTLEEMGRQLGLELSVGGSYVSEGDWTRALYGRLPLILLVVYSATHILLAAAFRSLLIPLKAILLNTLTVGAVYGVLTLIFQDGFGASWLGLPSGVGLVDTNVPIFVFAIIFGISMDYEVFLVSRIYETHGRGLDNKAAVVEALTSTGGFITSAAIIMISVFAAFIFSDVLLIKMLSFGLSVAVFLDATLVRLVLVPAYMTLMSRWNWWWPTWFSGGARSK